MLESTPNTTATPHVHRRLPTITREARARVVELYQAGHFVHDIAAIMRKELRRPVGKDTIRIIINEDIPFRRYYNKHSLLSEQRAVELYRKGHAISSVARILVNEFGKSITDDTVRRWVKVAGVFGMEPEDATVATMQEINRRHLIREPGAVITARTGDAPPVRPIVIMPPDEAFADRRAKEEARLEYQQWLPVIEAVLRRFPSMPRYLDHLRLIARLRHVDDYTDAMLCDHLSITPDELATDRAHPFSIELEHHVWSRCQGHCVDIASLLRSGVALPAVIRLFADNKSNTAYAVARNLGYI